MSPNTLTNPPKTKSWLLIVVMFIAGLGGGAMVMTLLTSNTAEPKPSAQTTAEADGINSATNNQVAASATEAATQEEIRSLREEVEQMRAATRNEIVNGAVVAAKQPATASRPNVGQRTLAYWNQLNGIMAREAAMRAAPPQLTAGNAMSFVSSQSSAFEFAGSAIRQLNTKGIDPQAAGIGREIAAWYEKGVANSRQAESLLGSDDVAARQGAAGQGWSSAEKQHREECLAINRRGEQLRQELTRKYGLEFPALQ
jgi:hypothetical protein